MGCSQETIKEIFSLINASKTEEAERVRSRQKSRLAHDSMDLVWSLVDTGVGLLSHWDTFKAPDGRVDPLAVARFILTNLPPNTSDHIVKLIGNETTMQN